MKIIQISDLHISEDFNINTHEIILNKMIEKINQEIDRQQKIVLVCCGDIVNKGIKELYIAKAKSLFDYIRKRVKDTEKCQFIFVPGNHDLCDNEFISFQNFINEYDCDSNYNDQSVIILDAEDIIFMLVNSIYHKDYKYGKIDYKSLEKKLSGVTKPIIVVMHHTLLSRYDDDRSAITNAYKFLDLLNHNNVIAVLHGHTHGYSNILVGEKCRVIGTGSLFADIPNCNNQFNIIDFRLGKIEKVTNLRYNADYESVIEEIVFENSHRNFIVEEKISTIYKKVRETVKSVGGINNLYMNVNTSLKLFNNDMEEHFKKDIEIAKGWLQEEKPASLYYNHGCYMIAPEKDGNDKNGIDFVVEELERNSTSNRAIIPLIRLKDVYDQRFDHLPGLNCIQFGFTNDDKTELYCSVYLRSLEVNHFLRINMSEIYLLIKKISKEMRSIKNVVISVYAFKAQYKENFSCFRKAKIDMMSPGDTAKLVYKHNKEQVIDILKDKFSMEETVINTSGLEQLYDVMEKSDEYTMESVIGLKGIIAEMEQLKDEYRKSSNYDEIRPIEKNLHEKQKEYLEAIQTCE